MTLVKELNKEKENLELSLTDNNTPKILLSRNSADKINVLKNLGVGEEIIKYENSKRKSLERRVAEKDYGKDIFHKDEVKNLCFKYALRLMHPKYYFGSIGLEFSDKVLEFVDGTDIRIGLGSDNFNGDVNNFYILAPVEYFSNETKKRSSSAKDAILFYKVNNDYYKMVYNWGNSFNDKRLLKGWRRKNIYNWYLTIVIASSSIILLGLSLLGLALIWGLLISIPLGALVSLIGVPWNDGEWDIYHCYFTNDLYNGRKSNFRNRNWKECPEYNIIVK